MKKVLIFIITFIIILLGIFISNNGGHILIGDSITENDIINGKMYSHIYSETIVNDETDLEKLISIYTFNENDNYISIRLQYHFSNIETAQEQYKNWHDADLNFSTQDDKETIITYNKSNITKNMSKKSVIEDLQKYSKASPENIYNWYIF